MKILAILLALTPSFVHVFVRKLMGASIDKGARIRFGTVLQAKKLSIGKNSKLGPFCNVSCHDLTVLENTKIKSLSSISARIIELGNYVQIAPLSIVSSSHTENAIFKVGDHSRIFPFCWIEPGEGIEIGNNVGIGGHTLIFTHGVWPDYVDGGPVAYGPVKIEDNVWLPWRVFVMPNVTIGKNAIIGANATVNKSIPENSLAAGSPAKVVKENATPDLTHEEKIERMVKVLDKFSAYLNFKNKIDSSVTNNSLSVDNRNLIINDKVKAKPGDLLIFVNESISESEISDYTSKNISILNHSTKNIFLTDSKVELYNEFIVFLRNYGIRLSINK